MWSKLHNVTSALRISVLLMKIYVKYTLRKESVIAPFVEPFKTAALREFSSLILLILPGLFN